MENNSKHNNELMSLDEIFMQGKRIFKIPDYQRGYSWEKQQRDDLITDIEYLIKAGYEYRHYTGTIVASEDKIEKKGGEYEVFNVVDGQQRLTSLILLLSVICRFLKESEAEHAKIFSKFIQDGPVGNTVRKLYLGQEQDELFRRLITEGITSAIEATKSKSDQNLKYAVNEYQEWLHRKDINIDDVLRCVCENLGFLFYAPKNNKELGIMFEVINNRGKALTELEKIKNYLIYYAEKNIKRDIKDKVNEAWPKILENLNKIDYTSNESEDSFLRNCWIVFMDTHKSRSHHVYAGLKKKWPPDEEHHTSEILGFIEFLKDVATFYVKYLKQEGVADEQEAYWLERISHHPADASITPLILAIFSKATDQQQRIDLFELLEKLNFRFYGTGIAGRSDSGQGELFSYANTFFDHYGQEEDGEIIDVQWLKKKLVKFVDDRANDRSFVECLTLDKGEAGDYYTWVGLKFFLASYEEHLKCEQRESIDLQKIMASRKPKKPDDFFHREHIWAEKDYTKKNDRDEPDVNKRRLGNFLLLKESLNIKVSNRPPEEKVDLYFADWKNAPNTMMIRELKDLFTNAKEEEERTEHWQYKTKKYWYNIYQRFFDKREEKMINFALERWRVSGIHGKISEVKLDSLNSDDKIYTTKTDNTATQKASDFAGSLSGPEDLSSSTEHMAQYGR